MRYYCGKARFLKHYRCVQFHPSRRTVHQKPPSTLKPSHALETSYKPNRTDHVWNKWWESQGFFRPKLIGSQQEVFSMVLPPPNITGALHLGHALTCAIEDSMARWHRMNGRSVVWVPGLDHAGIATQVAVERHIWNTEGRRRIEMDKTSFESAVWEWKQITSHKIIMQLQNMGCSLDWSRLQFTLDPKFSYAVQRAFIQLHDEGTIYRGDAIVNWCCALQSTISDIEVIMKPLSGPVRLCVPGYDNLVEFGTMYDVEFPVHGADDSVTVSTTRPETMVGDTAVAVHPEDSRYHYLIGKYVWHPIRQQKIPVIFDSAVNPDFGTGAVKVTPAHDFNDFQMAQRNNLPVIVAIDDAGYMTDICENFRGLKRFDARRKILEMLAGLGYYKGKRDHSMLLPLCSRTGDVIEPMPRKQWFLKCQDLAKEAMLAVEQGKLKLNPDFFDKVWFDWLQNIRDWCISRQLWWGHPIPAFCCSLPDGKIWVAAQTIEEACEKVVQTTGLGLDEIQSIQQDKDVLDTWFSSAMFPFVAFGWPEKTKDLSHSYPLSVMETGNDILFFWVARMVMMGIALTNQIPFKEVVLHGIIRDSEGRKMSKSLGNVIDPMDVIYGASLENLQNKLKNSAIPESEKQLAVEHQRKNFPEGIPESGSDALRMALCSYNVTNHFVHFDINTVQRYRLFCNKLWQATRFVLLQNPPAPLLQEHLPHLDNMDKWILSRLANMICIVNNGFEKTVLHNCTEAIIRFVQSEFCDVYLEHIKPVLREPGSLHAKAAVNVLVICLMNSLRALHPIMPFITEELYQKLPGATADSVTIDKFPTTEEWNHFRDDRIDEAVSDVMDIVSHIRNRKVIFHVGKALPSVMILCSSPKEVETLSLYRSTIKTLSRCSEVVIQGEIGHEILSNHSVASVGNYTVCIDLKGFLDIPKELKQIANKRAKLLKQLERIQRFMNAAGYEQGAPAQVKEKHLLKKSSLTEELQKLEEFEKMFKRMSEI